MIGVIKKIADRQFKYAILCILLVSIFTSSFVLILKFGYRPDVNLIVWAPLIQLASTSDIYSASDKHISILSYYEQNGYYCLDFSVSDSSSGDITRRLIQSTVPIIYSVYNGLGLYCIHILTNANTWENHNDYIAIFGEHNEERFYLKSNKIRVHSDLFHLVDFYIDRSFKIIDISINNELGYMNISDEHVALLRALGNTIESQGTNVTPNIIAAGTSFIKSQDADLLSYYAHNNTVTVVLRTQASLVRQKEGVRLSDTLSDSMVASIYRITNGGEIDFRGVLGPLDNSSVAIISIHIDNDENIFIVGTYNKALSYWCNHNNKTKVVRGRRLIGLFRPTNHSQYCLVIDRTGQPIFFGQLADGYFMSPVNLVSISDGILGIHTRVGTRLSVLSNGTLSPLHRFNNNLSREHYVFMTISKPVTSTH